MTARGTGGALLIAAASGRAIAAAARRDGFRPLVCDLFGDSDTLALAEAHAFLPGTLRHGPDEERLAGALAALSPDIHPPLLWGSGFEEHPAVLGHLSGGCRLLGTPPRLVAQLKDPFYLAALCARLGVPYPATSLSPPPVDEHPPAIWLTKRTGASGGTHIQRARPGGRAKRGRYYQRMVPGEPISALLIGQPGEPPLIAGWSLQWASPTRCTPFRFGGAARLAGDDPRLSPSLRQAARTIGQMSGLTGLGSLDFVAGASGFHLLEINPRPGATLDLFPEQPLIAQHVAASLGCPGIQPAPNAPPDTSLTEPAGSLACAVAYARRAIKISEEFTWPGWTADRSQTHTVIPRGAPVCTVLAEAADATSARTLAEDRATEILQRLETS